MFWTLLILAALAALAVMLYNRLVAASQKVDEAWSGITVQLKRRHDLVPNLIAAARSAMAHETAFLTQITQAREAAVSAMASGSAETVSAAEAALSASMRGLLAYTEDNPEVTAGENLVALQSQLEETEDQIAAARRLYNGNVQRYNTQVLSFPANLIAGPIGFSTRTMFELDPGERAALEIVPSAAAGLAPPGEAPRP